MDWMNQNANAGGYDPNTAPVNLSPFMNRAVGVIGDVVGQGANQLAAFGGGAIGVNHAFSNTPVYDKLVREPAGENPGVIAPNFAQRAGAVGYDVATSPFRALKAIGNYIDPKEVGPVASYTPSYDVIRGMDAKAAAAPAMTPTAAPTSGGIDFSKFSTLKTKAVPLEQAMQAAAPAAAAAPVASAPAKGIPVGALLEMAKVANTRKVIGSRDQILGQVYGWHRANYLDAMQKGDGARAQKALDTLTSIASPPSLGAAAMFGTQQAD